MNEFPNSNIKFTYTDEQAKKYIESLKLKSYDGSDLYFLAHDKFPGIYADESNKIYFFKFSLHENSEQRENRRQKLIEKYKKLVSKNIPVYLRYVNEYVLLIQDKIVRIFADCSNYQEGTTIRVLEIIAPDFTENNTAWLKTIIQTAFQFIYQNVPCFNYYDYT